MTAKKPTDGPKVTDKPTASGKRSNASQAKNWTKHNPKSSNSNKK